MATINIKRFDSAAGLNALRSDWDRLAYILSPRCFFHVYDWYKSYLDTLELDPSCVHFFAVYRGESLVGIVPLKSSVRYLRGVYLRLLELPHHPHLALRDGLLVSAADNVAIVHALVSHLHEQTEISWDALLLSCVPDDSTMASAFRAASLPRLVSTIQGYSHYVEFSGSPDEINERVSGSFRRNLQRLKRRASELGTLTYRSYRTTQELLQAFPSFLEVEASGWKGAKEKRTAIVCHPELRAFYERLIQSFSQDECCVINLLWLNDICIAGQFGLLVDRVLYILKIGYHEAYSNLAPGNLLMASVLGDFSRSGTVRAVSFVTGPPWSHLWRPETSAVWDHYVFNTTWRGLIAYFGKLILRTRNHPVP
ncbi:MAG: GNAT family N-acetyltransferase [Sulfuricaulis sp.]